MVAKMDTNLKFIKYGLLILIVYSSLAFYAWVTLMYQRSNGINISKSELQLMLKELCKEHEKNDTQKIVQKLAPTKDREILRTRTDPDSKNNHPPAVPSSDLVLFSTWGMKKGKEHIRKSILLNWRNWYPRITPALFVDSPEVIEEAKNYKWHLQNVTETSCMDSKIPTLRGMFQKMMSDFGQKSKLFGFCNGDLIFDDGLKTTISALLISEQEILKTRPVLILVKRINVRVDSTVLSNPSVVQKLAKAGRYPGEGSSDVFIANHLFPWKRVPELVVGRIGYGMWMVAFARANNITTYDLTKTVTAVHMTDSYGNHESSSVSNEWCNHQLVNRRQLRPKDYRCGYIDCSSKRSEYDKYNNIVFKDVDVKTMDPGCSLCKKN